MVGVLAALFDPMIQATEARVGDSLWRLSAQRTDERRLVIIDIDEKSLHQIGPWPWPRSTVAKLINQLAAQGIRQQILDIVFTDPRHDDAPLLQAVASHKVVLAQVFALPNISGEQPHAQPQTGQPAGALPWRNCPAPFAPAVGHLANHNALAQLGNPPAGYTGHITPGMGSDGVVRHQPAVVCQNGNAYPALALATVMQATGETQFTPQRGGLFEAPWSLAGQQQVVPRLPLDSQGNLRIGWYQHPDSFISISAADVLAGTAPTQLMSGAWALVGSSAFGLNDTIATPFAPAAAGMVAHAQILTSWLDGRTPYTPRSSTALQGVAAALGLGLLGWLVYQPVPGLSASGGPQTQQQQRRPAVLLLPLAGLGYAMLLLLAHAVLLQQAAMWVGWIVPALAVLLASLIMASAEHLRSRLERDRLYQHLSSYLPQPVAASLALQSPSGAIRASARHVSVLFADIRNFSAYCEARPPQESAAVLHAFFSAATQVVQRHGGVIEAFQGDAILAVWNGSDTAPPPHANTEPATHAAQALAAAMELLSESKKLLPDPAPAGLEPLQLGLGLETGPATAGSFGLASRRTHLVMGRTVTIANRLVNMTADLAHPILVGEGLATQMGGQMNNALQLQSLGTFLLDGLRVPHHVYAVPFAALASHSRPPRVK